MAEKLVVKLNNQMVDISSIDFSTKRKKKLSKKEKLFIFYYSYPLCPEYQNVTKSARAAGYTAKLAQALWNFGTAVKKIPEFEEISNRITNLFSDIELQELYNIAKKDIYETMKMDATEFYNYETVTDDNGNEYTRVTLKKPEDLTENQRRCIEKVEYNSKGIPQYSLGSKEKARQLVIDMYNKQFGEKDANQIDVRLTLEGIRESVEKKLPLIETNKKRIKATDFIDAEYEQVETED